MSAADGTWWTLRWQGHQCWRDCDGDMGGTTTHATDVGRWARTEACRARARAIADGCHDVRVVRIRPRVSLATAVRRCVEAKKRGVELWWRHAEPSEFPPLWCFIHDVKDYEPSIANGPDRGTSCTITVDAICAGRYIVATPEDAKRLDRAAKKKANARK